MGKYVNSVGTFFLLLFVHGFFLMVQCNNPSMNEQNPPPVNNQAGQSNIYDAQQQPQVHETKQQPPVPHDQDQSPPEAQQQQMHQQPPVPQQQQMHQQPPVPQQQQMHQQPPVPQQQQMHQQPPVPQQQQHIPQEQLHQQPPAFQQGYQQQHMHQEAPRHQEPVANEPVEDDGHQKKGSLGVDFDRQKDFAFHFILPPKEKQCFYYPAKLDFTTELEVVRGTKVDFYINDHTGQTLDIAHSERSHKFEVHVEPEKKGTVYLVCVDNRKDSWNKQQVEINFMINPDQRREMLAEMVSSWTKEEKEEALKNIRSKKEFVHLLEVLNKNLDLTESLQAHFRRLESHDRGIMEDNFTRVNTWSVFQLIVMVSVGFLQVFMIRSLFDERSAFHRLWKR